MLARLHPSLQNTQGIVPYTCTCSSFLHSFVSFLFFFTPPSHPPLAKEYFLACVQEPSDVSTMTDRLYENSIVFERLWIMSEMCCFGWHVCTTVCGLEFIFPHVRYCTFDFSISSYYCTDVL